MKNLYNKEAQDIAKEEKIANFKATIENLNDLEFDIAYNLISDFCNSDIKLNLEDIKKILDLNDKNLIDLFLKEYILFDKGDKIFLENFIDNNLNHENKEFVSDLIYFADDIALNIDYREILKIVKSNENDQFYSVLASLIYLSNNIKLFYIAEIINSLEYVVNNSNYFQSEQIIASLLLYRITNKPYYLEFIQELIEYDKSNLDFLNNTLKNEMYDERYFNFIEFNKIVKH